MCCEDVILLVQLPGCLPKLSRTVLCFALLAATKKKTASVATGPINTRKYFLVWNSVTSTCFLILMRRRYFISLCTPHGMHNCHLCKCVIVYIQTIGRRNQGCCCFTLYAEQHSLQAKKFCGNFFRFSNANSITRLPKCRGTKTKRLRAYADTGSFCARI